MHGGDGQRIGANGFFLLAALVENPREMIAHFSVLVQQPGGAEIAFGGIEIAALEIDPAERIPIGADAGYRGEVVEREMP